MGALSGAKTQDIDRLSITVRMNEAGTVTAGFYSAYHPSKINKDYVAAFQKANSNVRPNFISVSAYDGMHLIYEALKKTGGNPDGPALVEVATELMVGR